MSDGYTWWEGVTNTEKKLKLESRHEKYVWSKKNHLEYVVNLRETFLVKEQVVYIIIRATIL